MLLGLDAEKGIGARLARFNISPAYLACGVAMIVNTATDFTAGLVDPDAACLGVLIGCLVPIAFLPVIWKLRSVEAPVVAVETPVVAVETSPFAPYNTLCQLAATTAGPKQLEKACNRTLASLKADMVDLMLKYKGSATRCAASEALHADTYCPLWTQIALVEDYLFLSAERRQMWIWRERGQSNGRAIIKY
jgi:hypothetical protein